MVETTGGFSAAGIRAEEDACVLAKFNNEVAVDLGHFAEKLAKEKKLSIVISIQSGDWEVFKVALPGSKPLNDRWVARKARAVRLTRRSTMFERVNAEEQGINWHELHRLNEDEYAIHGGGFPIYTPEGFQGVLVISGLPQVDDHKLAVEILKGFKASYQG